VKQRGGYTIGEERRGEVVEHRAEHHLRPVGAAALEHRHAGEALQHLVEPALVAERSAVPVAGQAGIDEARIDRPKPRVVDPEPGRHRRTEIFGQNIGGSDHPMQHLQALGLLQIECERALAAVGAEKEAALSRQTGRELTQPALRRLNFDHVGTEIGKQRTAIGAG
jgi:hypothetical protein